MKTSDYIILLHKKLKGDIEPNEQKVLDHWLDTQPDERLEDDLKQAWEWTDRYKSGYEPDVQRGLASFKAKLQDSEKPALRRVYFRTSWWAAAASLLILAAGLWWWTGDSGGADSNMYATSAEETREVRLSDGSTVVLNASSQLVFSTVGNNRKASFSGEAYFSVVSDPARPFTIVANGTHTRVLGTAFNLRAYPEETSVEVEVKEGIVQLDGPTDQPAIQLAAKERGVCKPDQGKLYKVSSRDLNALAWHTDELKFTAEPFGRALLEMERYYRIDLELSNKALTDCTYNGTFEGKNIDELRQNLELIFGFKVEKMGERRYRLEGGRCR